MANDNCQTTIPKSLSNQSVFCPWTSRAPLTSTPALRFNAKTTQPNNSGLPQISMPCQHDMVNTCPSNHQIHCEQSTIPFQSIEQSTNLFFHFLRLMQLFPDVHPATLHTTLVLCKNNFFCAVDKLLYAKRCKAVYNEQKQFIHKTNTGKLHNRYHPYSMPKNGTADQSIDRQHARPQNGIINTNYFQQLTPLDVSVKTFNNNQVNNIVADVNDYKSKLIGPKKMTTKKTVEKIFASTTFSTDLPLASTLQCKLPIPPLSPICTFAEDLTNTSTKNVNSNNL
ncbi:hypothetical protein RN001_006135 [Aquatica leii]|uniref:Uncharacterized protein n=1 Tax=Aquatica leii TaxID=1421715 RepID=A0AAN7PKT2_9COLE|nr:hypothetical protein RN001_006135 [Aquatica leii]